MRPLTPGRRLAARTATAAFAAVVAAGGAAVAVSGTAQARPAPVTNPYSPAYQHAYRHGAVPTKAQYAKMRQWWNSHPRPASANNLTYGGGIDGIGVTTGHEKVYLVFYGSQWGTQGTDGGGNVTLSGDTSGEAPYLQKLIKGLGTSNELWSGVMTQYCDGVSVGAQTCPASNTRHVAYPTGGALAGVWVDESTASPGTASGHQLGVEAVNAAAHFGNTTAASNRDAQYVIVSPHGTNPDSWLTNGFCAWHDYNGDSTLTGGGVSSPYGDIAFTNLPYITDAGASCGQGFVNSNGTLDGVSIVEGHEYAETVTDQNPAGGWTDSGGEEDADKCAWITPGTSGGSFDLTVATGTFAMQTTWGNDGAGGSGSCQASHAIVSTSGGGGNAIANGGFETGSLSSWTASGAARGVTTSGPHSGTYAALLGSSSTPTNGNSSIAQTFTARSGSSHVTFGYNVNCPDTVTYDWATATLRDNTTGTTTTVLPRTCNTSNRWVQVTASITAGHSYTLTLTSRDDNYPGDATSTKYDDVATS